MTQIFSCFLSFNPDPVNVDIAYAECVDKIFSSFFNFIPDPDYVDTADPDYVDTADPDYVDTADPDYADTSIPEAENSDTPVCIVSGCKYKCKTDKFTYNLPESQEIWSKWLKRLNRPSSYRPSSNVVICYKHFHEHDFMMSYKTMKNGVAKLKRILKPTAIPSLQLSNKKR